MADSLSPLILFSLDVNPSLRLGFSDFGTDQLIPWTVRHIVVTFYFCHFQREITSDANFLKYLYSSDVH